MTQARNSSCTWLAVFAATMVCFDVDVVFDEADKAVAHRQCARNAEALKSEDGKSTLAHLEKKTSNPDL